MHVSFFGCDRFGIWNFATKQGPCVFLKLPNSWWGIDSKAVLDIGDWDWTDQNKIDSETVALSSSQLHFDAIDI